MPDNGVAHNLQTSPAGPLRGTPILRQIGTSRVFRSDTERNLRGGGRSYLAKLSVRFRGLLCGDAEYLTWFRRGERSEQLRDERLQVPDVVTSSCKRDDADVVVNQVLLVLDPLVDRHKHVERFSGTRQEIAILQATPARTRHRLNFMGLKESRETSRDALVKQQAHQRPEVHGRARGPQSPDPA